MSHGQGIANGMNLGHDLPLQSARQYLHLTYLPASQQARKSQQKNLAASCPGADEKQMEQYVTERSTM
ncbi:hypothetical protein, partial [endosymbiont of Lamellibrachia barhami]|uniref:hypothetical protein n=1 Tax=endosymbiont of Lamellibrachia barhami TaxID=205975 RepID=UPI001C4DB093